MELSSLSFDPLISNFSNQKLSKNTFLCVIVILGKKYTPLFLSYIAFVISVRSFDKIVVEFNSRLTIASMDCN